MRVTKEARMTLFGPDLSDQQRTKEKILGLTLIAKGGSKKSARVWVILVRKGRL